ncbi:MAG: hypothetical protein KF903_10815 [Dokdonella sp.]|nr:hypothetical protein [Dokdonella sp.]MBX3701473.1 hypothetical protein [Dokdonella sp.]MCW5577176.1 hypothetical protein [Dokdonella sp.]
MSAARTRCLLLPGLDGTGELFRWLLPFRCDTDTDTVVVHWPQQPD